MEIKIGEKYPLSTFEFFEYLDNGGEPEDFKGQKYYDAILKYIMENGSYVIEPLEIIYGELRDSMVYGSELNEMIYDCKFEDNKLYCVTISKE